MGSSLKCPKPRLQWLHNMPRISPVWWSWSTTNGSSLPQITHCVTVAFISARAASEITARYLPRKFALRYSLRQARHQLSNPLRFLLCKGKNSFVSGFSVLQRVQVSISMLLTTTLYALVALFRLSLAPASQTFWHKTTYVLPHLWVFLGSALVVSVRASPDWLRCKKPSPWRSSRPWGFFLLFAAMPEF